MEISVEARKAAFFAAAVLTAVAAGAFETVPRVSAKCLGVTRGKPFSAGLVFINGKYIKPPYVVERWGTGIRVNSLPVTGQVIDWVDFLKTQDPSRVEKKKVTSAAPAPSAPVAASAPSYAQSDADALDDLFDDDPRPAATPPPAPKAAPAPVARVQPPPAAEYELKGDFVRNDASKALVKRINDQRTEIDSILRRGGFIFFGDGYSRVTGDARTADAMLEKLPEIMQHAENVHVLRQRIRSAHMVYLNEILSAQIFDNRVDYRSLQERRQKIQKDREWEKMLRDAKQPLL